MSLRPVDADSPIHAFVRQLRRDSWFAALGAPLTAGEIADINAYADELCIPIICIKNATGWRDAERTTRDPNWSQAWWSTEQELQDLLGAHAAARHGASVALRQLSDVTDAAGDIVLGAAAMASARDGIADESLIRVAAGAATQACYQAVLAILGCGDGDHVFAVKYRLYAAGRWPLGVVGDHFHIF